MLHFLAKEKHPYCSQYSLIIDVSDVIVMMLQQPKFVRILSMKIKLIKQFYND